MKGDLAILTDDSFKQIVQKLEGEGLIETHKESGSMGLTEEGLVKALSVAKSLSSEDRLLFNLFLVWTNDKVETGELEEEKNLSAG
jgi:Mn-dependent DtxR family transcriptional regulator